MRIRHAVPTALMAAALAVPVQAIGEEAQRPAPGCAGMNFTAPRGDVDNPGLDLVGGFLTTKDGAVFANLVVANLDRKVDQERMVEEWFVASYVTEDGTHDRGVAHVHSDGTVEGGTFFEGQDGVVQIRLPGLSPDTPATLWAYTGADHEPISVPPSGSTKVSIYFFGHNAEEIEGTRQAASCAGAVEAPGSAGEAEPEHRGAPAVTAPIVTVGAIRARGRSARVALHSTGVIAGLRATLSRNGRVMARGTLRTLDGQGALTLTARRALRRGTYTLTIPGVTDRRVRIG